MLAAEAGKVLLEKNQELQDQYQRLQEEYLQKVEVRQCHTYFLSEFCLFVVSSFSILF